MRTLATKQHILENAGYVYHIDREIYFNRKAKKVFSMDFVEDHEEEEIEQSIRHETDGTKWRFYFNSEPADPVKRALEFMLG